MDKLIITAAVVGGGPTKENNPNIPYTPEEIADEIVRARDAGACIAHVHVRDPETGAPAFEPDLFRRISDIVRERSDILLNLTTSALNLTGDDVNERRLAPLELDPELCSFDIGSMNLRNKVFLNPPDWGVHCAKETKKKGVKPEIECFEIGHIRQSIKLIDQGLVEPPYLFQLCMGTDGGMDASARNFINLVDALPKGDVLWTAMGIGRHQFPMAALSMINGGHVRVGFEDNVYLSKGVLAKSNAELVEKAVRLAKEFGRDIATPDDAREILKLRKAD